jgi:hypothetical protein
VSDKDIIFNSNALTDKRMALDFTIFANFASFLHLNKRANLRIVADFTTIQIDKIIDGNIYTKFDIWGNFFKHGAVHLYLPASQTKRAVQPTSQFIDSVPGWDSSPGK